MAQAGCHDCFLLSLKPSEGLCIPFAGGGQSESQGQHMRWQQALSSVLENIILTWSERQRWINNMYLFFVVAAVFRVSSFDLAAGLPGSWRFKLLCSIHLSFGRELSASTLVAATRHSLEALEGSILHRLEIRKTRLATFQLSATDKADECGFGGP